MTEIENWSLGEIATANALLDMKADYESAHSAFKSAELEKRLED